jgi:hypothetical protein
MGCRWFAKAIQFKGKGIRSNMYRNHQLSRNYVRSQCHSLQRAERSGNPLINIDAELLERSKGKCTEGVHEGIIQRVRSTFAHLHVGANFSYACFKEGRHLFIITDKTTRWKRKKD